MILILIAVLISLKDVIAPVSEYYASSGSYGDNWTNSPEEADEAPDNMLAWDETDNGNGLYTFNFVDLPGSGTIHHLYLALRSNFSNPVIGNDELTLKYSLDNGSTWKNLDGNAYNGSSVANQSASLRNDYYQITTSLGWQELAKIYLGVKGMQVGLPDNEVASIDTIWLEVNYSDLQGPSINLVGPENANWNLVSDVTFYYSVSDALNNVSNCSLILNGNVNQTNSTINESITLNFTITNIGDNIYNWSINCTDNSTNNNENASEIRILYVDTTPPVINLENPSDDSEWNTSRTVVLEYNVSDFVANVSSCSLVINGSVNGASETIIQEDITQNFSRVFGNGNYTWSINCTDSNGWDGNSSTYNLTVEVYYPNVTQVVVDDPVVLNVGSSVKVYCNSTVSHQDGISVITNVNSTFYDNSIWSDSADNNNNHYTNISCSQINAGTYEANYSCSFDVWYYANNASWVCNVTAVDVNSLVGSNNKSTTINELYGISLYPNEINYSGLNAGDNSTEDVNITVTNLGNKELDITLYGYAVFKGDGLSMNCTIGNISVNRERYSVSSGVSYSGMGQLTSSAVQVDTFNLAKKTQDGVNSTKEVYWKMGVPLGVAGNCSGYVVFGAVAS